MEPTIYKPSIYKGAGIYKNGAGGGGGGGSINGFEILDRLYLGSKFSMGTGSGYFTNKLLTTISNEGEIIVKYYTPPNDHLGGNANHIFGITTSTYGSSSPGYSVLNIGAMLQHNNLIIKNGSNSYTLQRDRLGGVHELHFVNEKVFYDSVEVPVPYSIYNGDTLFAFPMNQQAQPTDESEGERPGQNLALVSLEIFDTNGKKFVDYRPARRLYDGKIAALDLCRCVFWDNGNFYETP